MIVSITGHRPEDLPDIEWVKDALGSVFKFLEPSLVIQGMAAGADLHSAMVADMLGIPFWACKPWVGHSPRVEDEGMYDYVLQNAVKVVHVSEIVEYPGPWVYHKRNEFMVDNSEIVVAVWGGKNTGGTAACVRYARKMGKPIVYVNPIKRTIDYGELNRVVEDDTLF